MNKNMSVTFVHGPVLLGAGHSFDFRISFSFHCACSIYVQYLVSAKSFYKHVPKSNQFCIY